MRAVIFVCKRVEKIAVNRTITYPQQNNTHESIQLGYQNNCDTEIALLSEDYNVIHGVEKCQGVVLLKFI